MTKTPATWTSGNKEALGTAIADASRVWFTMADGVLTEVFYPAPDQACVRLLELVVTDGAGLVSEERRDTVHAPSAPDETTPMAAVVNRCKAGHYTIERETITDPLSDVVLSRIRFRASRPGPLRLFCILEPHLGNSGDDNIASLLVHKGITMLCAERADGLALALACSAPLSAATTGFVGEDGRAELHAAGALTTTVSRTGPGNVSIAAEIDLSRCGGDFDLALAFARTPSNAAHIAHSALHRGYELSRARFVDEWHRWHAELGYRIASPPRLWSRSLMILKTLEAKHPSSGRVAGLSTPWGESRGPGSDGTYHLIWTRDLVESVGAMLAAGAHHEARHSLHYLRATQEADGHWPQNMRLDGTPVWNNDELDEVALPIVFLHLIEREHLLTAAEVASYWPMLRLAAAYIAMHGPATTRDRWEDTSGVTPFTIASAIVALLVASEIAELQSEPLAATVLRDLADQWNASIETWLYRSGGALAAQHGVPGYYVRARVLGQPHPEVDLAHVAPTEVSPDALALVRFGLRAADDPRITSTVQVIDALLRVELPGGPSWRRYPNDRYGEHSDGAAFSFDAASIGRPWPLLTGERAHYELARGNVDGARAMLGAMEAFANATGCLPEQVWDQPDIADRDLVYGGPSGSAAPLGWAHGEYVKLARSLVDGRIYDLPRHAVERYVRDQTQPRITTWRVGDPSEPTVGALRVVCAAPATVAWRVDPSGTPVVTASRDTGLGLHVVDLAGPRLWITVHHVEPRAGDGVELVFAALTFCAS